MATENLTGHTILIRTDSNPHIGTGHMMRCIALAQAIRSQDDNAIFALGDTLQSTAHRLVDDGFQQVKINRKIGSDQDAIEVIETCKKNDIRWVVVDGYQFGSKYLQILKDAGLLILLLDDYGGADGSFVDIIVNQNLTAKEELYLSRRPDTKLLLGPKYLLIRKEFLKWSNWQRIIPNIAKNVLVSLGGSPPESVVTLIKNTFLKIPNLEISLRIIDNHIAPALSQNNTAVEYVPYTTDIPGLMAWADLAILGGGSTCWEAAYMRLPSLVIKFAANQDMVITGLSQRNAIINLGWYDRVTENQLQSEITRIMKTKKIRCELSNNLSGIVDGGGPQRVLQAIWSAASDQQE